MARTRDGASMEGIELELKVDDAAGVDAVPADANGAMAEGVAYSDEEENDQPHSGVRGMTVAFKVQPCSSRTVFSTDAPCTLSCWQFLHCETFPHPPGSAVACLHLPLVRIGVGVSGRSLGQ